MFDMSYRKKLGEDLPRWRERGWVTAEGAGAILASLDEAARPGFGLAAVVGVLGVLLIGFGVFAFVGANWDYMPRIFRFGLLVVLLAAVYGAGAVLDRKGLPRFADAAVLLGGMIFAGAIALVGQTYHMAGEFADALLLWLAGATLAAFATRSVSGTVLALAGAVYWTYVSTFENEVVLHWGGLVAVLLLGALAVWLDSRMARTAAILALAFWIVSTTIRLGTVLDWPAVGYFALLACVGLAVWAAGVLMTTLPAGSMPRTIRMGQDLLTPALGGFLLAAGVLQAALFDTPESRDSTVWAAVAVGALAIALVLAALAQQRGALRFLDVVAVAVLGAATLGVALWVSPGEFAGRLAAGAVVILGALWWVSLGHAGHPTGSKLGLFAFGAEVLYLYSVTLGSLMDTALAFLAGGALFIGLAWFLFRLDKRLAAGTAEVPA